MKEGLDADSLRWASHYVQEWAERTPREVLSPAAFAGMEKAAVLLGAAAARVARGEAPEPVSTLMGGTAPGSPPEAPADGALPAVIDGVIAQLRRLREAATPGEWYLSELDGAWAASVSSPLLEAIAGSLGRGGGPERPIGECDMSHEDEAYALAAVNAVPVLIEEIERLRKLLRT